MQRDKGTEAKGRRLPCPATPICSPARTGDAGQSHRPRRWLGHGNRTCETKTAVVVHVTREVRVPAGGRHVGRHVVPSAAPKPNISSIIRKVDPLSDVAALVERAVVRCAARERSYVGDVVLAWVVNR